MDMTEYTHDYKTPYLRRHRFHEAVTYHKVVPLWPRGCNERNILLMRDLFDRTTDAESIDYLDFRDAEVGFPGDLNEVTVIEVYSATGFERMLELELDDTPRVWTPHARFYLFKFVEPSERAKYMVPGLRFLDDDEWMPYPGTMVDGQMVHWEVSPAEFAPMELPEEFRTKPEISN